METLILLHGWGVESKNYHNLISSLSKDYRVITPSLYELVPEKQLSWQKLAENLDKKVIGKQKVFLLGTSLGGGLALAYAAFYPKKVKGVIVCEPVGAKIKKSKLIGSFLLSKMSIRAIFYPKGGRMTFSILKTFIKQLLFNFRNLYRLANLVLEKDLEKTVKKIKASVRILWSSEPDILPLWAGERLEQRIETASFNPKFSNKNHLWCLIEQEKVSQEVKDFLKDTSKRGERGQKR